MAGIGTARETAQEPQKLTLGELIEKAQAFHNAEDFLRAEIAYRELLLHMPNSWKVWSNLGLVLRGRKHYRQAVAALRRALELKPRDPDILVNLGNAMIDAGLFGEALAIREKRLAEQPDDLNAIRSTAIALRLLRRHEEVVALIDAAEERLGTEAIAPIALQRAFSHLTLGNWAAGFRDWETRFLSKDIGLPEDSPWPRWQGEPLEGKRIAVLYEQGLGDSIVFARFLPRLKALGAHVTFAIKPPLERLLGRVEGVDRLTRGVARSETHDFYTPVASLPHFCGMPEGKPPPAPRLTIPEDSRARARRLVAPFEGRFKIGVTWMGATGYRTNHRRSGRPEMFLPLTEIPGVQLFSLYKGEMHQAFLDSGMAGLIVDASRKDRDLADAAALIEEMDLLVMTDTSVVHVAGSLGKPVWLLSQVDGYWLYGLGERNDWYPTMRVFRQRGPDDFPWVIERVVEALRDEYGLGA